VLLLVSTTDKINVITGQAASVDIHSSFVDIDNAGAVTPGRRNVAGVATATTTDASGSPAASTTRNVKTLNIRNKHASTAVDVTVVHTDGTTASELHKTTLLAGEALEYIEGQGFVRLAAALPVIGGVGTPSTAAQSLTAAADNLLTGTLLQLPTGNLKVGSRFRWEIGLTKTAAGVATWSVAVKYGTAGTTADAAIATFTSGTNTAAIDQATLAIEMVVASLGAAATASVIAMYVNRLTEVTGLGSLPLVPGSTAAFDSTAANPFLHVDLTPGAAAVMTSVASAERLA
jgi:hypothetical protein